MNALAVQSPRAELLATLASLLAQLRGGRYTPRRGPLPWTSWDFIARPFPVSIVMETLEPFPSDGMGARATISLGLWSSLVEAEAPDESVLDEMQEDVAEVLYELARKRSTQDARFPVAFGLDHKSIAIEEGFDSSIMVQGVRATFTVRF